MVRTILETDRRWAVYALADLAPQHREHCEWRLAAGGQPALLLLYRLFQPPVLFAIGAPESLAPLLADAGEKEMYLSVRAEVVEMLRGMGYQLRQEKRMWRMTLDVTRFPSAPRDSHVARLGPADLDDLVRLFEDGDVTGESPDFFDPSMLRHGVYFGIRGRPRGSGGQSGALVAAAGTHVLSPDVGVACVGNVYTRRDSRGRGLSSLVTAAVTTELLGLGLQTIALNVTMANFAAIRVYERLGFVRYCEYREGIAYR